MSSSPGAFGAVESFVFLDKIGVMLLVVVTSSGFDSNILFKTSCLPSCAFCPSVLVFDCVEESLGWREVVEKGAGCKVGRGRWLGARSSVSWPARPDAEVLSREIGTLVLGSANNERETETDDKERKVIERNISTRFPARNQRSPHEQRRILSPIHGVE